MVTPNLQRPIRANVSREEYQLLQELRDRSPAQRSPHTRLTIGDRISDQVAATMGSWPFIIIQSVILLLWVMLNVMGVMQHWDPYPFILLNLMLSFQAAYAAPIIMMSQNRQASIDRQNAQHDYDVDMKAELEIERLYDKMDLLRADEIVAVLGILKDQQQQLHQIQMRLEQHWSLPDAGLADS